MNPGCRGAVTEGLVTIHSTWLPEELLPGPELTKAVTFRNSSQKRSSLPPPKVMEKSPVTRSLSTTSLRKTGNWLSHKPYVQLLVDEESREISAMTQCILDTENIYNQGQTKIPSAGETVTKKEQPKYHTVNERRSESKSQEVQAKVDEYVKQVEQAEQCRKEIQHKRWTQRVADPLQKTIEKYIDNQSSEDIEKRRRRLLAQYLRYCNKKGNAFMRDYDSSEYDPFINRLYKQYLRVSTPMFQDPLLQQSQKRYEEERIAMHCETGRVFSAKEIHELNLQKLPSLPLGRQSMNGVEWLKTPLGYIESETRLRSRQRVRGSCTQGSLDLKLWTDTKSPLELFTSEMKISHKRKFPARPSSPLHIVNTGGLTLH